jgi:N-methylhydantoinase A/acetophenone carboxylase
LLDAGALSIVIALRNSAANPVHEEKARQLIEAEYPRHYLGSVPVLTANAITADRDDHVRANTAILNAYIHRDMVRYLYRADEMLRQRGYRKPLLVAHSSGGAARVAKTTALNTYNSGPAAGLIGCCKTAKELYGVHDFVSVDVGGTSVDIGVGIGGRVTVDRETLVEGIRIGLPMVTLDTAAGGGGSIARLDFASNKVQVGPDSAGALPGPVCYDLGGVEPTVTDADLVLGFVDEAYFLGGRKKVIRDKARGAISSMIADSLGVSAEEAAWSIVQTTEEDVARQIREHLEDKGLNAEELTLFAFGGGGGLRCCGYASRLGISKVVVFGYNAVASAFGASTMDVLHMYERSARITLRSGSGAHLAAEWKEFNRFVGDMVAGAKRDMRGEGLAPDMLRFTIELCVSGAGGFRWIESPLVYLEQEDEARRLAGLYAEEADVDSGELVIERLILKAECPIPHYQLPSHSPQGIDPSEAKKGVRDVFWGDGFLPTDIYERGLLQCGNRIEGPAIVEAPDTTYLIPKGWTYTVDKYLNGLLEADRREG